MIIRKVFRNIHLDFNIYGDTTNILEENMLNDICITFSNITPLNKQEDFNTLVLKQQKHSNHLLMKNPILLDELRVLIKMINNFLIITKQSNNFSLESLIHFGDDEIYAHGSEMYLGNLSDITFSPSTRAHWLNPNIINKILTLN